MSGVLRMVLIWGMLAAATVAPRAASGQDPDPGGGFAGPPVASSNLFVGGTLGLSFGDVDYVEIAPLVGTWLSPQVSVGGSLIFRYRNDDRYAESLSTTDYGGSIFGRYFVWEALYLHTEVEYLSYEYATFDLATERDDCTSVFVGGGAGTPIGGRSSVYVEALYNLSYADDEPSPYNSPWVVRFGVGVGF